MEGGRSRGAAPDGTRHRIWGGAQPRALRQSAQRRGAATAATIALRDLALESLGQARIEIAVAKGNEPSLGVARRAGAAYECLARNRLQLHGRAVDAHLFSFTLTAPA